MKSVLILVLVGLALAISLVPEYTVHTGIQKVLRLRELVLAAALLLIILAVRQSWKRVSTSSVVCRCFSCFQQLVKLSC